MVVVIHSKKSRGSRNEKLNSLVTAAVHISLVQCIPLEMKIPTIDRNIKNVRLQRAPYCNSCQCIHTDVVKTRYSSQAKLFFWEHFKKEN